VEIEMAKIIQKKVCLLVNLGGFETRMVDHLEMARWYGETVYSLTGDGIVKVGETARVPVDVISLTLSELLVWSAEINEQLIKEGFEPEDTVIFAAGRNFRGTIPLGSMVSQGIRIGA
jgi:hypothetical protein